MADSCLFGPEQRIHFTGDSITDCGRRTPEHAPLGRGYVYMAANLIVSALPERFLVFENSGIGGNTLAELTARWDTDVLATRPDWLSVLVGINDCHRHFRHTPGQGPDDYRRNYAELLRRAVDACGCRLVLWEPFLITHDTGGPIRRLLQPYIDHVNALADEFDALLIHTQALFDDVRARRSPEVWAADAVHPTPPGHALMARAFCRTAGLGQM